MFKLAYLELGHQARRALLGLGFLAPTTLGLTTSLAHAEESTEAAIEQAKEANSASELPRDRRTVEIALDGSYAASGSSDLDYGGGGALRVGYAFPFAWAALVPEGGIDVWGISGVDSATLYGAFAGGRARFGRGLEPGISAHVGVTGVSWRESFVAPTADVGLFLEMTFIPKLILGVQGEYKSTISAGGNPSLSWYTFGLTVGTRL